MVSASPPRPAPALPVHQRTVFSTPRVLEFFTDKELAMQLGVGRHQWALALVKELLDNALDACETVPVAPEITVTLRQDTLSVADNGPGLPYDVLTSSLDYLQRISDKAFYVSPTRGQLGNALKAAWAAPFVVSGTEGRIDVQTATYAVTVRITLDRIAQQPVVAVEPFADGVVQNGTSVTLHWPDIAS